MALAFHSPDALSEEHQQYRIRSDEEIAADIMRGMALWKNEMKARKRSKARSK